MPAGRVFHIANFVDAAGRFIGWKGHAYGIRRVLEDEELALKLAVAGHARVQRDFSRAAVVDRYLELYRSLLGSI
jgi:hypothetical protein